MVLTCLLDFLVSSVGPFDPIMELTRADVKVAAAVQMELKWSKVQCQERVLTTPLNVITFMTCLTRAVDLVYWTNAVIHK